MRLLLYRPQASQVGELNPQMHAYLGEVHECERAQHPNDL